MRSSRASSLIHPGSEAHDQSATIPAVRATNRNTLTCGEAQASADPKFKSQHLPSDLPAWAAAIADPSCQGRSQTRGVGVPDHDGGNIRADDRTLLDNGGRHSKRSSPTLRGRRLEPLFTVPDAATILNVSERTVRRLIASGTIRAVRIGRSVRLRPRDIERLIADGGVCND
jgi:excisionase family DNA binding protein